MTKDMCITKGCGKAAVSHPEWDNEYCSIICCYNHCKTTFEEWLVANKTTLIAQTNVASTSSQVPGSNTQKSSNP